MRNTSPFGTVLALSLALWQPHACCVVAEGVFREAGSFVPLPDAQVRKAEELWRERVFALLLDAHKIDEATAASMRAWPHSARNLTRLNP